MKKNILKIIFLLFLFIPIDLFATELNSSAYGVALGTSGVKESHYEIERCSPHASELSSVFGGSSCQKGFFYKIGSVGYLTYKGENFETGNVVVNDSLPSSTRDSNSVINLFDGVSSLEIEGEGTYSIRVFLLDYANNASVFEFKYKIDKTAPKFQINGISENTPYTYVGNRITGLDGKVTKFDSVDNSSTGDNYINPDIDNYSGDLPQKQTSHDRQKLYSFYFRNPNDNKNFTLNTIYSDDFNLYLSNSLVSGGKRFELLEETGETVLASNNSSNDDVVFSTNDLTNSKNSQKKYRLRLYDDTVAKSGSKPNYSEIIFYAVRDNTFPNTLLGDNNTKNASKLLLRYDSSTSENVWDEMAQISDVEQAGAVSKFIEATESQLLYSSLSDNGITGDKTDEWYNAGLDVLNFQIENQNNLGDYDTIFTFPDRFENLNRSGRKDFSQVDNHRINGYRKYLTKFISNGSLEGVCDAVGNCLKPNINFRVVAKEISNDESTLSIKFDDAGTTSKKIFANGTDKYIVNAEIKDEFGNAIVGVTAEDNNNKIIKKIDTSFEFENGLYSDTTNENGSGNKLVTINDLQDDNIVPSSTNNINTSGIIYFYEKEENTSVDHTKGTYSFNVVSKVPTNGVYPYGSSNDLLKIKQINTKASYGDRNDVGIKSLGIFNDSFDLNGTGDNVLSYNNDFLFNNDYETDLNEIGTLKNDFGTIELYPNTKFSYNEFLNKRFQFEYAPLFIYGAEDLTLNHLINNVGQTSVHTKKTFYFDPGISNTSIFEKYLPSYSSESVKKYTPNIFNIYSNLENSTDDVFDNSTINPGTTIPVGVNNWEKEYKIKSSPIKTDYLVNSNTFNMGYISYLEYDIGGKTVKIPSVSRNVVDIAGVNNNKIDKNSYTYFPENTAEGLGDYKILKDPILNSGLLSGMGIAITGLSNNNDTMISDETLGTKANINVGENLTRYDYIKNFKKNVFTKISGVEWCENIGNISNLNSNAGIEDCTIEIQGELISFIKGNIDINCGTTCQLSNDLKRTIIVQDGSTYIKSNISTFGKESQFLIATIANNGLSTISIPITNNPDLARNDKTYGWTFVDPSVTNIDAFIVSQGPVVSYNGTHLYNSPDENTLKNQLHVYGSILSLNTIGGYKSDGDSICPYIIDGTCNSKTAFIFDLVTLRRYSLEGDFEGSNYLKVSGGGKRSGGNDSLLNTDGNDPLTILDVDTCVYPTNNLRCIKDVDYIVYPLFVERDTLWNDSTSIMFSNK